VPDIHHVLGHVGIFRALVDAAEIDADTEARLFDAVQRKAYDEISEVLNASVASDALRELLTKLTQLSGDENVLDEALAAFASAPASVRAPLDELAAIAAGVQARVPGVRLCFDLCELRGYQYHTGVVFAAYTPIHGRAVAKGGRYDDIGEVFGRARPASGFDSDLKTLVKLSLADFPKPAGIAAPLSTDSELIALVAALRASGEHVVSSLSEGLASAAQLVEQDCDRVIVKSESGWEVKPI
jgi:ATP phosphoribosyltransferase regulatory subunit